MSEPVVEATPAASEKKGNLKIRLATGTCYVLVLLAFFVLKLFVSKLCFDMLVLLMSALGTFEMVRAFSGKLHMSQVVIVMLFSSLVILTYALADYYYADLLGIRLPAPGEGVTAVTGRNYSLHITSFVFLTGIAALFSLLVFCHKEVDLASTGLSALCYLYPSSFLVVLSVCNHLELYSEMAILLIFVICPFADSLAYVFGRLFGKKLPAKMAPHISPKKTIIGGFGGLVGGAIGAVASFFACVLLVFLQDRGILHLGWSFQIDAFNLVFFIALGILTSAFSQFGDLVESAIKRKLGIKDMGKLLPGHGGILDRIDSTLYAAPIVCAVMVLRIMLLG